MLKNNVGKLVIVGDSTVGKTALLQTFLSSGLEFSEKYNLTMGVVASIKEIYFANHNDPVILLFYDCTGLDLYHGTLSKYWKTPDMLLAVYDVSSASSLNHLNEWIELIKTTKWTKNEVQYPISCAIFANKTDLIERRIITTEKGKEIAGKYQMQYFEGSAKTNDGINEIFHWFSEKWHDYSIKVELNY
ncbi:hypothetical protein PGB90_007911 [Kerria lacca]